ncbi:BatD family protein [Pseudoxanthomonas sp.]|uniref:BatD family protein n=1 Tax=Pseudoxanthomonas sp. TaxID=1871049 RepID=UPI00263327B0|nr:BatD family protein [Pseudoxanthomonas sp.]WDS37547.1 MAG: BatD family protein [Pseudoxanthomonas sp.]
MRADASMQAQRGTTVLRATVALLALLLLLASATPALAATRAWLDRSRTAIGQPVVLSIESDQEISQPDLAPLQQDFDVIDTSSSRQMEMVNGRVSRSVTLAITLQPRRTGELSIPALDIQGQRTPILGLRVTEAPAAQPGSSNAYIETEVDDLTPYVQQTVGVTLRLFYAVPLVSGQLDLDPPQGISLQRVGDDVQSTREVNGRRYSVVERRFLLVPDRSGTLSLPAARFSGRGAGGGGFFDSMLGMGQRSELSAVGQVQTLHVQAQPDNAPQPWLPLADLRLRYATAPRAPKAGQASSFVVEAIARGATRAQLPDLPTPAVDGAQVFAEPAEYTESFDGATPVVKVTRQYSLVPSGAGKLTLPGLKMDWWDVKADQPRTAALPDMQLDVAAGSGNFADATLPKPAPAVTPDNTTDAGLTDTSVATASAGNVGAWGSRDPRLWMLIACGFALLWLLTLGWMVLRPRRTTALPAARVAPGLPAAPAQRPRYGLPDLRRALETGTLDEVGEVLVGMAPPPTRDLDAVAARLADPVQRRAVDGLRRARWADGDGTQARNALREAFAAGPSWIGRRAPEAGQNPLPPLYPER